MGAGDRRVVGEVEVIGSEVGVVGDGWGWLGMTDEVVIGQNWTGGDEWVNKVC